MRDPTEHSVIAGGSAPSPCWSSVDERLEGDQRAGDDPDRQRLEERGREACAGEPAGDEPVESDEADPGPLRARERRVLVENADGGEDEEDRGKGDAEGNRGGVAEEVAQFVACH